MGLAKLIEGLYSGVMLGGATIAQHYNGDAEWFTKGYLHDITLPFGLYFFSKLIGSPIGKNKGFNAAYVFLACSAGEAAQGFGLYSGTFDPKDFLAYAAGAGLAVAVDRLTFKKKDLDKLVEESI
ncbi:hypothetical protein HYU22_03655 [Candidatus Woesearchaeota archaeon]|nr:hypothetical protein [Candidatus Woesearchaeota archaeon]